MINRVLVRRLGLVDYQHSWSAMKKFTEQRDPETPDEIWLLQHPPVYTLGMRKYAGPAMKDIPVVSSDRGGLITYHGPGQFIAYVLMDLKRRGWGVRRLVQSLEQVVIDFLGGYNIKAERMEKAPGVYVRESKVASLGLRVRRGASYHGLSVNVNMDLTPFDSIDPCGFPDLNVTQLKDLGVVDSEQALLDQFQSQLVKQLGYEVVQTERAF